MPSSSRARGARAATFVAIAALAAVCGCSGQPAAPPPAPPGAIPAGRSIGSGAIEGRVLFEGTPPARRPIRMGSEAACHRPGVEPLNEDIVVSPGGALRNVLVHVVSGLGDRVFAPPATAAVMD